jgi:hypothetical protein
MVMALGARVEAHRGAGMWRLHRQSETHERVEDPIDGGARHVRHAAADRRIDLIRSGMVGALREHLENGAPLHRDRHAVGPACRLERRDLRA